MKSKIKLKTQKANFQPVTIAVTIESYRELEDLFGRTKACPNAVNMSLDHKTEGRADNESCREFYENLKTIYEECN